MKLTKIFAGILCAVLCISGCQSPTKPTDNTPAVSKTEYQYTTEDILIPSIRGTDIHASIVIPKTDEKYPVVLMLHGFRGSKSGSTNFEPISKELGQNGIASVRFDFAGCGESEEPTTAYTMNNMNDDINSVIEYMTNSYNGDTEQIALLGHSMGGRSASLRLDDSISAAVLMTPANGTGLDGLADFMDGIDSVNRMYDQAKKDGKAPFTLWGDPYDLSATFFEENETADPLKSIHNYNGKLMVVVAKEDAVIDRETYIGVIEACQKVEVVNIENASHVFSAADGSDSQKPREKMIQAVVEFFVENLQ